MHRIRILIGVSLVAVAGLLPLASAFAESPGVTAVLSTSEVGLGETVRLQVRVTGSRSADAPEKIDVEGLQIHRTGTSQHFEMNNLKVNSSVLYDYTVLPQKTGTFKIPPQEIRVGGTSLRTPELTLHVVATAGRQAVPGGKAAPNTSAGTSNVDASKFAFAELIVPKKSAYVGEIIPAVVRIGFAARLLGLEGPEVAGQGFTMQKLKGSEQPQIEVINGRQFEVYTFKTAISAARAGKFDIGPVKATAKLAIPTQSRSARPRSPFDLFNMDDPFSDPFFADPFGRFREKREVPITSEPVTLEVKPLPPNAPANFSGAVGNFAMTVDAKPKKVQVGDPITVTAAVSGRGSFDRMSAPSLEDERGWHKYPSSSNFKQDDEVGISGTKTFETVISPNERKQDIPPFAFAFFDPSKENYVTLRSDPMAIQVQGGSAPAQAPAAAAAQPAPPTPASVAGKTTPKPQDILPQLTERSVATYSFSPLYARRSFWLAQIFPFAALLGLVGWKIRRSRLNDREAQRTAALHREATELMRQLRRADAAPQEYFSQASRAVQVKTALARNVDPSVVDAGTAATTFHLDEISREQLQRLFERSDELRYSGKRNGGGAISSESRREVIDLIESLHT